MLYMLLAVALPLFGGVAASNNNVNCTVTPSTCNYGNVTAVFGDTFLAQYFDYACESANDFASCLDSLPGCVYADPNYHEARGYSNALIYLCQEQVKQAVQNNLQCLVSLNFSAINESCSWTYSNISDYCEAENMHIKCIYNVSVVECGPVVGQIVSVTTIKIATPQLFLYTDEYCELFNNEASCFPSLSPEVCGRSSMTPYAYLQSLDNYNYTCSNAVSFASCADDLHCLPVDDMYASYQQLQWLVTAVQYACSDNASTVILNNIDCISTIDLTSRQFTDCVSDVSFTGDTCKYNKHYLRCINDSAREQCGNEVADVYTTLLAKSNGLNAALYNCSDDFTTEFTTYFTISSNMSETRPWTYPVENFTAIETTSFFTTTDSSSTRANVLSGAVQTEKSLFGLLTASILTIVYIR